MKAGDKVLKVDGISIKGSVLISLFEIDKFSKDGKKVRDVHGRICDVSDGFLVSERDSLISKIKAVIGMHENFLLDIADGFYKVCGCDVYEDDFNDVFHIYGKGQRWLAAKNYGFFAVDRTTYFSQDIEGVADFIIRDLGIFQQESLLEKYNKWQEKFGYDKTDEFWTDYLGGTTQLEWAIDNDIDCLDYDRWQLVQKLLKHELKYETANDIFNTLYEKEDIEIFDCE